MTFLNGVLLAGAAAFMIPLMIHLLNRQTAEHREVGCHALASGSAAAEEATRSDRAMATAGGAHRAADHLGTVPYARPVMTFFRSPAGLWSGSLLSVVLLDDWFSMRASGTGGSPQEQAKLAIQRMVDNLHARLWTCR